MPSGTRQRATATGSSRAAYTTERAAATRRVTTVEYTTPRLGPAQVGAAPADGAATWFMDEPPRPLRSTDAPADLVTPPCTSSQRLRARRDRARGQLRRS